MQQKNTSKTQDTLKPKFIDYYMNVADLTAQMSSAVRLKVGTVIVKNNTIIGIGYNGTPSGWDNVCEDIEWCNAGGWLSPEEIEQGWPFEGTYVDGAGNTIHGRYRLVTKDIVLHGESNALMKVARSTESSEGALMFSTHAPCLECAKLIYQSGISHLYYRDIYRDSKGLEFLKDSGVPVTQHSDTTINHT